MKFNSMDGNREAQFRDSTNRQVAAVQGVMSPAFKCRICKKHKLNAGRKRFMPESDKYGYVCAECHARRQRHAP